MTFLFSEQFWGTASVVVTIIASVLVPWLSDRSKKKRTQQELDTEADREWFESREDFHNRITEKVTLDRNGFEKGWDRGVEPEQGDPVSDLDDSAEPRS